MRTLAGLLASTTLSTTGNAIVAVAVPWLVLERIGSATTAGLAGAAAILPVALSALFGGAGAAAREPLRPDVAPPRHPPAEAQRVG